MGAQQEQVTEVRVEHWLHTHDWWAWAENSQEVPNCPQTLLNKAKLTHHPITMLTLDSITFFFYSCIISNYDQDRPPSKTRRATCNPISTWIDSVPPNLPLNTLWTAMGSFNPLPSLMVGSTWSLSNSAFTNGILLTQNTQLPTGTKKAHINVKEKGIYSDYGKMTGQEQDKVISSPLKHGVHATSSVCSDYPFNSNFSLFTRISSLKTNQYPLLLPRSRRNLISLVGLIMKSSVAWLLLLLLHTMLARRTHGTDNHLSYAMNFVSSWSQQVGWILKSTPKGQFIKM